MLYTQRQEKNYALEGYRNGERDLSETIITKLPKLLGAFSHLRFQIVQGVYVDFCTEFLEKVFLRLRALGRRYHAT